MSDSNNPIYSDLDGGYSIYQGSPNISSAVRNRGDPGRELQYPGRGQEFSSLSPQKAGFNMNPNEKSRYAMDPMPKRFEAEDSDKDKDSPDKKKGIMYLLNAYADKSSLNGVIFIKESKYIVAKIIWTLLLLAATVVMVLHLYELASKYYQYEKQSQVDLKFQNLKFPAVTFCNVNAMKKSKIHLASENLQQLIDSVDPEQMYDDVDSWEPAYEDEVEHFDEYGDPIPDEDDYYYDNEDDDTNTDTDTDTESKRRNREKGRKATEVKVQHRTNNFFDDFNFTDFDDTYGEDFGSESFSGSWEAESEPAAFDKIAKQFINLYNKETGVIRQQMGHRIQDMLIQCSFTGRKCVQQNFTRSSSSTMGNCYTIQYSKFLSRKSGPKDGLSLMLYMEPNEYIPGITNAQGIKLVVHEPGTLAFPDDEGMAVSAGMETSIGLRRISIKRLGQPHGRCTSTSAFKSKYNIKYTRQACQQICEMEETVQHCGCYDNTKPVIYSLLKNRTSIKPCQKKREDVICMEDVQWFFDTNETTCHCDSPCTEVVYRKTISSKPWPQDTFGVLVAKTVCKEKPDSDLCNAVNMPVFELRENFLKVNIFFETLNFEDMTEQENYSEFQFLSDIGGTVGLYIGLSVLSFFEVFHLIISICKYLCCGKKK